MVFKTLISQVKLGVYAKTSGEVIGDVATSVWSEKQALEGHGFSRATNDLRRRVLAPEQESWFVN
jgi:hypothetical protein